MIFAVAVVLAGTVAQGSTWGWLIPDKDRLMKEVSGPLAQEGLQTAPLFTLAAGWDFASGQWKLNEFTNQLVHFRISRMSDLLFGKQMTLVMAVIVETSQFFGRDHFDPKWLDRGRDICFYLLP